MPFLSDQKNWRAPRPPPRLIFSPKSTDRNFEIAILFRIVKNHNNFVFGNDLLPTVPGGGAASYKLRPVFTYNNGYLEVYSRFQGIFFFGFGGGVEGREAMWEDLSLEKYVMGEQKFNEKGAGFSKITIKKKQGKNKHGKVFFN